MDRTCSVNGSPNASYEKQWPSSMGRVERRLFEVLKRRFGACLGLSDRDLRAVVRRILVPPMYDAGRYVLREGQESDLFTVLASGSIKVGCGSKRGTILLQIVGEGHAFALPVLADPAAGRRFSAVARCPSIVGLLSPNELTAFIGCLNVEQRCRLLRYGWNASATLLVQKRRLLPLPAEERLLATLTNLADRFPGSRGTPSSRRAVGLRLTQTELGQLIGATRSTVNRCLQRLGPAVVSYRHGRYVLNQVSVPTPTDCATAISNDRCTITDDTATKEIAGRMRQQAFALGLSAGAARAFCQEAKLVICPAGTPIAMADRSDAVSLIVTGSARVQCTQPNGPLLTLLMAKPGWLIPGSASQRETAISATAHQECCVAILTGDGLARVAGTLSAGEFLRFLSFGWRVFSDHTWRACRYLTMNAEERVKEQLALLAHDFPGCHGCGTFIDLDLRSSDIAQLVGADERSVGRILNQLQRAGCLTFDPSSKRILMLGGSTGSCGSCTDNTQTAW